MSPLALTRLWIPLGFLCAVAALLVTAFIGALIPFGWISTLGVFALLLTAVAHTFVHAKGPTLDRDYGR